MLIAKNIRRSKKRRRIKYWTKQEGHYKVLADKQWFKGHHTYYWYKALNG